VNKSTILLTTTKVLFVQALSSPRGIHEERFCSLQWKCGILWVRQAKNHNNLAALQNLQWLRQCLKNSSANLVCIDLNLGEAEIKFWADSCRQVKKKIFIRLDPGSNRSKIQPPLSWIIKSTFDRITAVLLLLLSSPVFLVLIILHRLKSQSFLLSRDWKIGKGGQLFQSLRFQLISENIKHSEIGNPMVLDSQKSLIKWIQTYSLDKLPQLINVLCGEMSIVGPRALNLYDAMQINPRHRYYLHCLPGILNPYPLKANQSLSDVKPSIHPEYQYLEKWNLMKDIKIVLILYFN
jgi:lipopolysaccharide/colanic/teichoic acid biosynthesis glycosyltransferase